MHHLTDDLLHPDPTSKPSSLIQTTSSSTNTAPLLFPLFPLLPTELRLKIWFSSLPTPRILSIQFSPSHNTYIPSTTPPLTLSINHESRSLTQHHYVNLRLSSTTTANPIIPIPFYPARDTVYITNLAPMLATHLPDLLYNLSTSRHRHLLHSLALDLRVWNGCRDAGLLGVLARMKSLEEVCIVVEFGRGFKGETAFLETPKWRGDLDWVAKRAAEELEVERERVGGLKMDGDESERRCVEVRCVLLTRGGEQA